MSILAYALPLMPQHAPFPSRAKCFKKLVQELQGNMLGKYTLSWHFEGSAPIKIHNKARPILCSSACKHTPHRHVQDSVSAKEICRYRLMLYHNKRTRKERRFHWASNVGNFKSNYKSFRLSWIKPPSVFGSSETLDATLCWMHSQHICPSSGEKDFMKTEKKSLEIPWADKKKNPIRS